MQAGLDMSALLGGPIERPSALVWESSCSQETHSHSSQGAERLAELTQSLPDASRSLLPLARGRLRAEWLFLWDMN